MGKNFDEEYMPNPNKKTDIPLGKWSITENQKYIKFLRQYKNQVEDTFMGKKHKIYKLMSGFIGSRTPEQCRGHHRKMLKFYNSVEGIIDVIQNRNLIDEQNKPLSKGMQKNCFYQVSMM